ncbi:MAG: hypothetical protein COV48_14335 [Elusimicrobia bacterium CG11_big_fil_rev_8_21_14_0_20_64_6]|nr:MAG: hypothetical protein COV48_14335 [Elusimicrobia bacterium CG11_big_fil_rev_8_21_14_0_20_64_6]
MGSPIKAILEEKCRPLELEVEKACGNHQTCRDAKLRALGYDFRACVNRWNQDGGGAGSIGAPLPPKPNKRPARCVLKGHQAKSRTAMGAQIYTQGTGGGSTNEDGQEENKPAPPTTAELIQRILSILKPDGRWIGEKVRDVLRIRGTIEDANKLFERLTNGMKIGPHPNPKVGSNGRHASNGQSTINLRPISDSGPPTIDISVPGGPQIKVKFIND